MPRIRKKTSNRGSTNERKKILHKVRESRKKKVKAAKKNPQWVSKHKKDPGIPNNFPFKDQILAEVAEQRRLDAEDKQRRKDEKKAAREKGPVAEDESEEEEEEEEEEDGKRKKKGKGDEAESSENVFDGIVSLHGKRLVSAPKYSSKKGKDVEMEVVEEEEEAPILLNRDLPTLKSVLDVADVVIEVLDARDPLSFRSSHLEELIAAKPGKKILLLLNKIDTCPRESVTAWAAELRTQHPTLLFRSASSFLPAGPELIIKPKGKGKAKERSDDGMGVDSVLSCLGQWAQTKKGDKPLTVAVVGLTNAGKSSFINSLAGKAVLPVYTLSTSSRGPTTTTSPQEVTVEAAGKQIRIIDTPGLSWESDEDAENIDSIRARDILMRNKGRIDRLKDPALEVAHIVSRADTEDLMLLYSLPAFAKGDPEAFLSGVARSNQFIKRRGALDLTGASRIVLRDWSTNKFPRFTVPSVGSTTTAVAPAAKLAALYANDEAILSTLKPRKEMRKTGGLVKFVPGEIEGRKALIDAPWVGSVEENDDEDEDDEEASDAADEEEASDEEDEEESEEEPEPEPEPAPPVSGKQKRKLAADRSSGPPHKKVAFAADPKESKQARSAGSRKGQASKETPQAKPVPKSKTSPPKKVERAKASVAKPKAVVEKKEKERKVANVAPVKTKASQKSSAKGGSGEEAYDFGKFF